MLISCRNYEIKYFWSQICGITRLWSQQWWCHRCV
jgi:hypothetical protein